LTTATRPHRCPNLALIAVAVGVMTLVAATRPAAATPDPTTSAPRTTTSADGLTTSDGARSLHVDQARGIPLGGATLTISGSGYEPAKGVYIAFCVIPRANQRPTPCGGGADTEGTTGASTWISSNPPPYGRGLAVGYGPGGSFTTTIHVETLLAPGVDCTKVRCGIISRNDHTRSSDRTQDLFVPIRFVGTDPPLAPPTTTSTTAPSTTVAVTALAPAEAPPTTTPPTEAAGGGAGAFPAIAMIVAASAAIGIAIVVLWRRRRR
jgi:hypothetical protein